MTTNAHPQFKTSMENLAMEVAKLFAQVSHQVDNDLFVIVKKLIQDLIWKLQLKFLRKTGRQLQIVQRQVYNRKYSMRISSAMMRKRQMKRSSRMCGTLNQS